MIHKTAIIEQGATIEEDVDIGPFCIIGKNVTIKKGSKLKSHITIKGNVTIEENVQIFSFANIGDESLEIFIDKNTIIREFVHIQRFTSSLSNKIYIGKNNFIMGHVHIYEGVTLKDFVTAINAVKIYQNVTCDSYVMLGGSSTIQQDINIGMGAMIGGASYVEKDIPPFTLVEGNKAIIKNLNLVGLRRRLENKNDINTLKNIFKQICYPTINKSIAQEIYDTHTNQYVKEFAKFIIESKNI